jgi:tRNA(Ile)-lysidine synthase
MDGLAGMPLVSCRDGVRLLRPLLPIAKSALLDMLRQAGQPWVEDPSNHSPRYTRNTIRHHMQLAATDSAQAFHLSERLGRVRGHMEQKLATRLTACLSIFPEAYAKIDSRAFAALPAEYGMRALAALLQTVAGQPHSPRSEKLSRCYRMLMEKPLTGRHTIGGCILIPRLTKNHILVCREPAALQPPIVLPPGEPRHWDGRFLVSHHAGSALTVAALGTPDGKNLPHRLEKPAFSTLPAFWHLEQLVAVPHIGYCHPDFREADCRARYRPVKPLAGHAFCSMNCSVNNLTHNGD